VFRYHLSPVCTAWSFRRFHNWSSTWFHARICRETPASVFLLMVHKFLHGTIWAKIPTTRTTHCSAPDCLRFWNGDSTCWAQKEPRKSFFSVRRQALPSIRSDRLEMRRDGVPCGRATPVAGERLVGHVHAAVFASPNGSLIAHRQLPSVCLPCSTMPPRIVDRNPLAVRRRRAASAAASWTAVSDALGAGSTAGGLGAEKRPAIRLALRAAASPSGSPSPPESRPAAALRRASPTGSK